MQKTYKGSCHCGEVRFEADIDLSAGTGKCNCSMCAKSRNWSVIIKPEAFRLLAGESELTEYQFGTFSAHYMFCKHCGLRPFGRGYIEQIGGAYVSVNLACLDDVDLKELVEAPIHYADGRNNNWRCTPDEIRHL
ncbi:GFA family protein [Andreprevotia chitinilytica]|uniref:GFA family protein n=1 Tax=Andreprevotia chitinilytica TaxID=396808 RepID=UPI0005552775|nr:GFA family protein [Andreprevotia chitinilytica]